MVGCPDVSEHLVDREGFCHPDWDAITALIEAQVPESGWNAAWGVAARQWVERIRDGLGGGYQLHETTNFLILTEAPKRVVKDVCKFAERSLGEILRHLAGAASDEGYGKHVVLMFASLDDYYGYIGYFYPEGEHPMSGGVCLRGGGYEHFAFPTVDYSSYRTVLVHELTHVCIGCLPLPPWLDEALAMRMEEAICGTPVFTLDQEVYDRHMAYWNVRTIQQFWTGESWSLPGDSFELSYNLAQVIWRKIESDLGAPRDAVMEFVRHADFKDGGEAAFAAVFGLSLGDLVMDFLGEGSWAPDLDERGHADAGVS